MLRLEVWTWFHYYWYCCKHFGRECYRTWRWELAASALVIVFTAVLSGNWKDFRTALVATALTLGCFIVWHVLRVPWLLHRAAHGGTETEPNDAFGIFGLVVIAAVFVGGYEFGLELWRALPMDGIACNFTADPGAKIANKLMQYEERIRELKAQNQGSRITVNPALSLAYPKMEGNEEYVANRPLAQNTVDFLGFANEAGGHIMMIHYINPGPGPANDVLYGTMLTLIPGGNNTKTEEAGFAQFKKWWLDHQKEKHPEFWSIGEKSTSPGQVNLLDADKNAIIADTSQFYFFSAIQWTDDAGRHQFEFCGNFRSNYTQIRECKVHCYVNKSVPKLTADKRLY